jgi:hypothetical protein
LKKEDSILSGTNHRQILMAVPVPVADPDVVREPADLNLSGLVKASVSLAEKDPQSVPAECAYNEISDSVPVEVGLGDDMGSPPDLIGGGELKFSPQILQNHQPGLPGLDNCQIGAPVPINVHCHQRSRTMDVGNLLHTAEFARSIAEVNC